MAICQFSTKIRKFRFENGQMTQAKLAEKCRCSRQTISSIERSKYNPSLVLALRIAYMLDREIGEVFEFKPRLSMQLGRTRRQRD
jgi:putative transcriptional regulator